MSKTPGKPTQKPTAKPSSTGGVNTSTRYDPSGTILPVDNPVDLCYLCIKMEAAYKNPYRAINNTPRYQRQVTKWIRQDAESFDYKFPYCGEVGYNMTTSPPTPIMSKNNPNRPSSFPLSQYRHIYREYRALNEYGDPTGSFNFESKVLEITSPMITKTELENTLNLSISEGNTLEFAYRTLHPTVAQKTFPNGRGLIRIPDVIRKQNFLLTNIEGFHPDNIALVIEVKFPQDRLSEGQRIAYLQIANNDINKFRLITLDQCERRRRRRRSREEEQEEALAKADPIYMAVGEQAMNNTQLKSIEEQIQYEYYMMNVHVVKWISEQEIYYSRPQLIVVDDTNEQDYRARAQQLVNHIEMVEAAPLMAVGIYGIGVAMASVEIVASTGAASTVTLSRGSATVLQFSNRLISKETAVAGAAALATQKLAASSNSIGFEPYYFCENDVLVYCAGGVSGQAYLQNLDDRLIEYDYRYGGGISPLLNRNKIDDGYNDVIYMRHNLPSERDLVKPHYYPYQVQYYYYFADDDPATMKCSAGDINDPKYKNSTKQESIK